jgi:hypothetical protein
MASQWHMPHRETLPQENTEVIPEEDRKDYKELETVQRKSKNVT